MSHYNISHYCGVYHLVEARSEYGAVHWTPTWLAQVSLSSHSKLYDTASRTTLTQVFANPNKSSSISQATYNFPLYESCAVVSFRCYVGKRLIKGVVKEKEQAKAEYKVAVERNETAGLLEQHTPDVFSTSIGNIPAGVTVTVEIEYIMELKHDAEADGLRFTIPASIAPRYGNEPSDMSLGKEAVENGGMKISVQITMPSSIRTVQSPSHTISMHLGGHVEDIPEDAFDPKLALATLGQTSTELASDFVLIVKCGDLSMPRALVETHPIIQGSKALVVTLVPKFNLPEGPRPEIVIVADRSGSMGPRIAPLRSALGVILKSLPVGIKFNICSFGSSHSFLWTKSKRYTASSLAEAQRYVENMKADFGGTEILPPIQSTISNRYKDMPLEIMVLTDGEVWGSETLFEYIEKETRAGDVRLFSLGIGVDVSHALVEGMARVGRGFAQIVSNENEGIEAKVVRMLRGCLSAHVKDYRIEWEGRISEGKEEKSNRRSSSLLGGVIDKGKKKISLFDTKAKNDHPISFTDLPELVIPNVIQAPFKLPSLFPFSRTTAYVIFSQGAAVPSSVWLRGTTASGDELELEIAVQAVSEQGITIHQLAARKVLQELEEGTGYVHSGKYGVGKETNLGTFEEYVKREGVRVGVTYGLASKWTSFLAVQKKAEDTSGEKMDVDSATEEKDDDFEIIEDVYKQPAKKSDGVSKYASAGHVTRKNKVGRGFPSPYMIMDPSIRMKSQYSDLRSCDTSVRDRGTELNKTMHRVDISQEEEEEEEVQQLTLRDRTKALIALQSFEGSFSLTSSLATLLEVPFGELEAKIKASRGHGLTDVLMNEIWATVLAVTFFERKLVAEKEVWDLVVQKAKSWMAGLSGLKDDDLKKLELLAEGACARQ